GKSFFMSQLHDAVADLAGTGGDAYYKRIVQIDFNAWHYVESNLWASLVENIFRNLRIAGEKPEDPIARTEAVLQRIDDTLLKRAEQEKKVEKAQLKRDEAAKELETKKAEVEEKATKLNLALAKDVWDAVTIEEPTRSEFSEALKNLGIDRIMKSTEDVRATIDEIRQLGDRTRLLWFWATQKPGIWMLLCGAILLAPLAVAWAMQSLKFPAISSAVSQLVSIVAALVGWISLQLKRGGTAVGAVEEAKKKIDGVIQKAEARKKETVKNEQDALDAADRELVAAQRVLQEQNEAVKKAEEELMNLRAGRQLARFIGDRAASDDYRKLLGVLATARNDFEHLSALMRRQNDEQPLPAHLVHIDPIDEQYRIDRIVLYIDDLDRCPPNRVVEVLQAVHLLLAFKLFVVVVGVDARWVSESLEYKFRNVWKQTRMPGYRVGARDYLEKIFQIPYWLNTLDLGATKRFVARLVEGDVRTDGGTGEGRQQKAAGQDNSREAASASRGASTEEETTDRRERLASATPLQLSEDESNCMKSLADLIGRSPRAVKRYINTYRIIRATVPQRRLASFLKEDYRSVLLLLAIVVGVPEETFNIFKALESATGTTTIANFAKTVRGGVARTAFEDYGRDREITVGVLRQHINTVSRYSFDRREKAAGPEPAADEIYFI
ncbi:MAG TPA: P-loop NTPase fold protein, partial [Thermoanaerobaculia bacterium]|nr:P-loop NTPase fold protein [Thermoanaerobaculia bacterium]